MKVITILFSGFVLVATTTGASAAAAPAPVATNAPPAVPAPAPAASGSVFDAYIAELASTLKLTVAEKKQIEDLYVADGPVLKKTLNDDALSPLQKARQVSDLRDVRNAQIGTLLQDVDRQQAFLKVETKYRVALTELAAEGGLVAAPPPLAPAPPAKPPGDKTAAAK